MTPMPDWTVERLAQHHVCLDFDCGQPPLSEWLRRHAKSFDERDLARVYVAVRPGQTRVFGYYAVSNTQLDCVSLPPGRAKKGLPSRMALPAVLIGKLAVDRMTQGQKLGARLLIDAFRRIQQASDQIGLRFIVVEAINDVARDFYIHYGFESIPDDPRRLFLSVAVVRQLGLRPLPE